MIYPGSSPEFRMFERRDGTVQMQVRYINATQGYEGKWMDVKTERESDMKDQLNVGGGGGNLL
jgi:hypothetical protein